MSYQKQPKQNGANSGPSISPTPPRCFTLYDVLWSILIAVLIVGLIILVIRHKVRTHEVKFYATNATLTTFNFTNNTTNNLNFNLEVSLTSFNPNPRISIYYDYILVDAIYEGQRLKTIQAEAAYHKHKNTTSSPSSEPGLVFKGQKIVVLASYEKSEFDKQSNEGVYEIEVKLHLWAGLKVGLFKIGTWKATVVCDLNVPLAGKSPETFQETKCHYYF